MLVRRCVYLMSLAGVLSATGISDATTYYVSNTGNDNNNGTSPGSAWSSLTKVDSTTFAPGSQILFQDGGNWYGQLAVNSSGTTAQPITYGNYGSGTNPTIWGSVPVAHSSLQQVASTTYFYPSNTPVYSFLVNHQFYHNADLLSSDTSQSGLENYVENNAGSACYISNGTASGELVNTGQSPQYMTPWFNFTAVVQADAVLDNGSNNVVIQNLTVRETAQEGGGYGIRVENTRNVQVLNCTVTGAGKHAVGVIDSNNFLGENLSVSNLLPDQSYGGATAYVSYADQQVSNTTAQWINDSFTNGNGPYQAFITHTDGNSSDPDPISSILLQNMTTDSNPALTIESSPSGEQVKIIGGKVAGDVQLLGGNTLVDGLNLTSSSGNEIQVEGNNNTIQNTIINGVTPNWTASRNGAIDISGQNNIIRFNTISLGNGISAFEAAIALENNQTNSQIYGNVINTPYAAFFQQNGGLPGIYAHDNLFSGYDTPEVLVPYLNPSPVQNWPTSVSANEWYEETSLVDPTDGNLSLVPSSIGAYLFNPATNQYVMYDYNGNVRPDILESLGAIQAPPSGTTGISWNVDSNGDWTNNSNWTNNQYPNGTDLIAMLGSVNSVARTVTLNTTATVGVLYFSSAASYTLTGTGSLIFNSSSGQSQIDVSAGSHTISVGMNLTNGVSVNLAASSVLNISGKVTGTGTMTYNGAGTLDFSSLSVLSVPLVADGVVNFGFANHGSGILVQTLPAFTIGNAGVVSIGAANAHANRMLLVAPSLTFNSTAMGLLDIANNDLDIKNGNLSQITQLLASGFNGGTGPWNGSNGIISTSAAADTTGLFTLGVIQNSVNGQTTGPALYNSSTGSHTLFDGQSLAATDVLVKYTYYGDTNLDGKVDGSDYSRIDNGTLHSLTGWYNGDFNYDGVINGSDYTLIDNAFNRQGASMADELNPTAYVTTQIASPATNTTAVPEPASAALLLGAVSPLLGRRRAVKRPSRFQ